MTFWTTQFHKSDADNDLSQTIDRINDAVVRLRVVLGNDDTQNTVLHDLKILKKDRALARFGWLSERRTPRADEGKLGDFYIDSSSMKICKKTNKGWTEFDTLRGQTGPQGVRGESFDPFHMITDIVRYAEYYVYIHPSRFDLIEKTGKHSYRGRTIHDFSGKSLTTPPLDISRDENDRYYATLGLDKTISVRVHFNSLSHLNKAFAVFQVFEVNADPTTDVLFNIVNIVTPELMDRSGLSLRIAPPPFNLLVQPFTSLNQGITVDNSTISGKLSTALGETVTKIQHIVGKKCVLSYSRDEQGDFFIYVNSILIFTHTGDDKPFIRNRDMAHYYIGGSKFLNATTQKFYCHLHFSKSLSPDLIKRMHAQLMTHYGI